MWTVSIYGKTGGKQTVRFREAKGVSGRSSRQPDRGRHRRFGWIAARPFSGGDCGKQTFVQTVGQGATARFPVPQNQVLLA